MMKKPFYSASTAFLYIVFVSGIIYTLTKIASDQPDNSFLIPIFMLSLLVLSVATMGYLFFYQPLILLLAGDQKSARNLFLKTVGIFFTFTLLALVAILYIS